VAGSKLSFYELKFLNQDMTILVPINNVHMVGIRCLSTIDQIHTTLKRHAGPMIPDPSHLNLHNWNRRSKRYRVNLCKGDLDELCEIYRDLNILSMSKELSFGEKTLLQQTELLLAQEFSLVNNTGQDKAIEHLRMLFNPSKATGNRLQSVAS
jgi:CarD family transcriptional regulator